MKNKFLEIINSSTSFDDACNNISNYLKIIFNSNYDKKELLDCLIILIKYTNSENAFYLNNKEFINQDGFFDRLLNNLDSFCNPALIIKIILKLEKEMNDEKFLIIFEEENIKKIEKNCGMAFYYYFLTGCNKEKRELYFLKFIEKNVNLRNLYFNMTSDLFYKNIEKICMSNNNLYYLKSKMIFEDGKKSKEYLEEYINSNPLKSIKSIIYGDNDLLRIDKKDINDIAELIKLIIDDIIKNEENDNKKIKYSDINILPNGAYSVVLQIGNKILKIGKERRTKTFKDNPYIVRPLLRKEYKNIFIEVMEKVDTIKLISNEELYDIYKSIRNYKMIFLDINERNIGRLIKDNIIHWNSFLPITSSTLNLKENKDNKVLKKGEWVIFDNDYFFDETNIEELIDNNKYFNSLTIMKALEFEKRFLKELEELLNVIKNMDYENAKKIIIEKGFKVDYVIEKLNNPNLLSELKIKNL